MPKNVKDKSAKNKTGGAKKTVTKATKGARVESRKPAKALVSKQTSKVKAKESLAPVKPKITPIAVVKEKMAKPVLAPKEKDKMPVVAANANEVVVKIDFAQGDFVVYPTHGVGKIVGLETQHIAGYELQLFVINFEKDRMTLRVPIQKARTSGLRRLSTRKEMQDALGRLRGRSRVRRTMWSRRAQEYEAKINSGDPASIAEVVRDLHRNSGQPDQSYSERQIYQAALDRLAREFAAIEKIDEETAAQRLEKMMIAA
jgi:CarD family transcriptional regulator